VPNFSIIKDFLKENKDAIQVGGTFLQGGLTAFGQVAEGNETARNLMLRQAIALSNAKRIGIVKKEVRDSAKDQDQQLSEAGAKAIADQIAAFAGRGVVVGRGATRDITQDTARTIALDRAALEDEVRRAIVALDFQEANLKDQAAALKRSARSARRSAAFSAAGTLFSTAGKVASKWLQ